MSVLSCFPFEDERNQFAAFALSNYHWKIPSSWRKTRDSDYSCQVLKWSSKILKSSIEILFPSKFPRNKLPPKTQNAGSESTRASAPKVLQLLFRIWVEMEINSGAFAQSKFETVCRTLHPICVISLDGDVQQLLEKIKILDRKSFSYFSLFCTLEGKSFCGVEGEFLNLIIYRIFILEFIKKNSPLSRSDGVDKDFYWYRMRLLSWYSLHCGRALVCFIRFHFLENLLILSILE